MTGVETLAERLIAHGAEAAWGKDLPGRRRFFPKGPVGSRPVPPEPLG
ncbi:hypothetical protein SSP531S_48060 [Streptomyces spongiicola]|uniref:Uncharacterized protein n=1 Tax=Streptomyces spongiicola TaxID=1690221 RepID=A0A388T7N7_9ACTN|nr:hypothetical protein [Streptomyces spongiicola]GBQ03335.1 hypothetical protein SSP531S_48060 [Streptomyces spongiicola]